MISTPSNFASDESFHAMRDAIVTLATTLHPPVRLCPGEVAYALGDVFDIWPESVRCDLDAAIHRERQAGLLPTPHQIADAFTPLAPFVPAPKPDIRFREDVISGLGDEKA